MSWQETVLNTIGPGGLCGVTLGDWCSLLVRNRFRVSPRYWPRALLITSGACQNSFYGLVENLLYARRIRETQVPPPLFILGCWRSGTTHLHNLLGRDPRFSYPNTYQVMYAHTFLTTERFNAPMLEWFIPHRRPQDNIYISFSEPQEDEFALNCVTQLSPFMTFAFPANEAWYDRFVTFKNASQEEIQRWQAALKWFAQKLTCKDGRPLVLKSPGHTGRIKMLLDVFPDARFVHICRNPYKVFPSWLHTIRTVSPTWGLQKPAYKNMEEHTLAQFRELYDAYFAQRELIPAGRLHELKYEDLERDPIGELRKTYAALDLPEFATCEPTIRDYLATLKGYEKNKFTPLAPEMKSRVADAWRPCFEAWGYAA